MGKIVKNFVETCLSKIILKGLIASNETIKLYLHMYYMDYSVIKYYEYEYLKNDKKVNILWLKKAFI